MRDRTIKLKFPKVSALILLANVLGCAIYLLGAQHSWVMPEEEANGIHSITGEPFVWAAFVLPLWIVFLVINLAWAATIVARKLWLDGRIWLTALFIRVLAVIIDFAHH
jgi:hypothetical protein